MSISLHPDTRQIVAVAREFVEKTDALRVSIATAIQVFDKHETVVIEIRHGQSTHIQTESRRIEIHGGAELQAEPFFTHLQKLPPFEVDAEQGTVIGTIGGLYYLAQTIEEFAKLLPKRSVVAAEFATTTPRVPLGMSCRLGEPTVVMIDDSVFELPAA